MLGSATSSNKHDLAPLKTRNQHASSMQEALSTLYVTSLAASAWGVTPSHAQPLPKRPMAAFAKAWSEQSSATVKSL